MVLRSIFNKDYAKDSNKDYDKDYNDDVEVDDDVEVVDETFLASLGVVTVLATAFVSVFTAIPITPYASPAPSTGSTPLIGSLVTVKVAPLEVELI